MFNTASRLAAVLFALGCVHSASAFDDTAIAAMQRGDFPSAEILLRTELKLHPADAETLSLLGMALDIQKKFAEADSIHRQALAAAPGSVRVLGRYGSHLLNAGDEKGAAEVFQKALAIEPADRYANLQLAQLALKHKDAAHAKEALLYLDRLPGNQREATDVAVKRLAALDLSGDRVAADALFLRLSSPALRDAGLSASLGSALAENGQLDRAETLLTRAMALDPSDFRILYNVGVVSLYQGRYERAREVLETAVRKEPDNVDALYSLAFVYSTLKQPEATLRLAAQAATLAPRRAEVQRLIAVTAGELQANQDSADAWDRYAALAPNDEAARRERGFARIHLRQFETGMADLEWYIARHPDDPVGHYELGLAQSTSDPTKGIASLDRALKLKPDFVAARAARGALYYLQGEPEAALPDLISAAANEPSNGVILDRLGQVYRALDRLPDAIAVLRKAVALAPEESTIQLHLGNALAETGQNAESEALMDRYRQRRPTQAPRDLMRYLSLTPEQQRTDYRARVEKAVHDNPLDATAQLLYLKLSLEENQIEQAAAAARVIAGLKPGAAVLADAGRALLAARRYSSAKDFLERAADADSSAGLELDLAIAAFHDAGPGEGLRLIERVPEGLRNADYHLARAQMLSSLKKPVDAIAAVEQALLSAPDRPDLYWQAAVFLNNNGQTTEALRLLAQAARDLPGDPQIPLIRATLLESTGQAQDAARLLDDIQQRWPENAAIWVTRGIILAAHRHFDEARRVLDTAILLGARSPEAFFYFADSTARSAPDRMDEARTAAAKVLKLAPEDPLLENRARQIAGGAYVDASSATPDPLRLFRTKPPQDW